MGLIQNLIQGFANAAGATDASQSIQKDKDSRLSQQRELSRDELHAKTDFIINDVNRLYKNKANLQPGVDDKTIAAIDAQLGKYQNELTDLYHPEKNPGHGQHLASVFGRIFGKQQQQEPVTTPGQAKERAAGIFGGSLAGISPKEQNPILTRRKQLQEAGVSAEDIKKIEQQEEGLTAKPTAGRQSYKREDMTTPDGKQVTVYRNNSDPSDALDSRGEAIPPELLKDLTPSQKQSSGKWQQEAGVYENRWGKKVKDWTPEQLTYFNQKMAYDAKVAGEHTHTVLQKDQNGNVIPVTMTDTTTVGKPPVEPGAAPVKTPGEGKQRMGATAPRSNATAGAPLPFRAATPAVSSAQKEVKDAVGLSSLADQVAQKPNDAINQKRLAVALERVSAGRFTTQALDYIIKAGWGNTMEQWANNPTTGALPADVLRQLVDGAHQNLKAQQDALAAAEGLGGGGATGPANPYRH